MVVPRLARRDKDRVLSVRLVSLCVRGGGGGGGNIREIIKSGFISAAPMNHRVSVADKLMDIQIRIKKRLTPCGPDRLQEFPGGSADCYYGDDDSADKEVLINCH